MPHRCSHTSGKTKMVDISFGCGEPKLFETEDWGDWAVDRTCEYGVVNEQGSLIAGCIEWCCPICGCNKYGGIGDPYCPCEDWIPNHEERHKKPVAVKPSLGTNGQRRRRSR